jgi:phage terminase large subunit-like protein
LNQRVEMNAPFVSRATWAKCGGPVAKSFEGVPVFGGLDLSEVADLTALVLVAPVEGVWHVRPTFWLPAENLREKSRADSQHYDVWAREGHLATTPGPTIEYEYIAEYLRGLFDKLDIRKIAFDRWNWRHLRPWLAKAGFTEEQLEGDTAVFQEFGQGFQSMSPALRDLEAAILTERMVHGMHPVLTMCAANATVQTDPAGNRKLSKAKSHGRIDGMVALAMAMSVAGTLQPVKQPTYQMMFLG